MPWSLVANGTVRDISFRQKREYEGVVEYQVYVGDESWGMVQQSGADDWTALPYNQPEEDDLAVTLQAQAPDQAKALMRVNGFRSQKAAATYIVKHHGYWIND